MPGFRSPLDAYREDLSRAAGRKRLAAGDEFWIILATGLRRLSQAPSRSRSAAAHRLAAAVATFAQNSVRQRGAQRSVRTRGAGPTATGGPLAVADALRRYPQPDHAAALVVHVRGVAADAE